MDELFSGDVTHLAENKASLQESFDSLQSACNLTEIVMKDKGVEMLLLKKEIQGKMDHLLDGALPPEPPDLKQLDIRFVPGEVKLGDVFLPGEEVVEVDELKKDGEKVWANGVPNGDIGSELSSSSRPSNASDAGSESCVKPCKECVERKRKIEKEESRGSKDKDKVRKEKEEGKGVGVGGESRRATKSVYIQTLPQDGPAAGGDRRSGGYFTTTASQVSLTPSGISVSHSAMQTHTATVSSRHAGTDSAYNHNNNTAGNRTPAHVQQQQQQPQNGHRARGTMTDRQDVRTLKIQTEESCLRDSHLGQAAATGSTYPNTGAAIAAAFLRHKASDEDVMTKSWSPATRGEVATTTTTTSAGRHHAFAEVEVAKDTRDAEVATDISLGLLGNTADAIAALCRGEGGGGGKGGGGGAVGRSGADASRPDLLAQTGGATTTTDAPARPPSSHSPWIRSRKVQTEISALEANGENGGAANKSGGGKFVSDDELNKSLFGSSSSTRASAPLSRADCATTLSTSSSSSSPLPLRRRASRAPTRDAGVMTSFKVKLVQDTEEKETSVEAATSRGVGVMTSPETRAVYIQTRGPRVTSTATGTDYDGQMSKSTSTLHVAAVDAETAMPQVTHESRTTWTEAVVTSERATCTASSATSDAATLTAQIRTGDFAVQVKPQGVSASTGTDPAARLVHHQCQTSPSLCSRGTMPDPKLLADGLASSSSTPSPAPTPTPTPATTPSLAATPVHNPAYSAASSSLEPAVAAAVAAAAAVVAKRDKATETVPATCVTRAVGPSSQMQSSRTASTDTLHLLQVRSFF